jgi:para-aminobenzoate synthetase / 4-amino-4-deoxychorismate lyase
MILFESLRGTAQELLSFWFERPELILQCREVNEIIPLLRELDRKVAEGYTAAGFLCYEAGQAFLPVSQPSRVQMPLAWFALTRHVRPLELGTLPDGFEDGGNAMPGDLRLNIGFQEYDEAIRTIREWIAAGYTYQVNYTMRLRAEFSGSARSLYRRLRSRQRVDYAAYLETPDWTVLSLSPELFLRKRGNTIVMKPMKGTAPRGRTNREDAARISELQNSAKEQSENLMIVDMLRSDLGKVCEIGSVVVSSAMDVDRYETLLQMTSTIAGKLKPDVGLVELFSATFPSGSVTGAPKIRTMQIIDELERDPRGIYTGCIGFINREESVFNVAIRTIWIDRATSRLEMGTGSGILYEADAAREYRECELKGAFLTQNIPEFQIFETILWTPREGYRLLPLHLDRLSDSALYFGYPADLSAIKRLLGQHESAFSTEPLEQRVRLALHRSGAIEITAEPLQTLGGDPVKIRFSEQHTDSSDPFYFHKTSRRGLYEDELRKARAEGYFDVLFENERSEITEGAITNVFIKKAETLMTPPIECGLLAGTFRRHLLDSRAFPMEERVLFKRDLLEADQILICNALRGLIPAVLE